MVKRIKLKDRILPDYTRGEEIFNMVSHIVGGGFGVIALATCVIKAFMFGNAYDIVGAFIYGFSMVILYTMSSLYHGLKPLMAKKVFQVLDHCTIFALIAGTYTPVALSGIRPMNIALGWTIFGFVWGITALGITLNAIDLKRYNVLSMVLYIALGLLCGSVLTDKQAGGLCGSLLTNLSAWLSGVWFDLSLVGETFRKIANLLPFVHAVELERCVINGKFTEGLPHLFPVVGYTIIIMLGAILLFLRQMRNQ